MRRIRSDNLHLVHTIAEAALKAVAVEQRQEQLKILLLAVVGRGGHQQEVPRQGREQLPEFVAPGVFDLAAKEGRGEFMRLVTDHQVPAAVRGLELLLHVLVARQLVQAGNDEVIFQEPVAGARRFQLVVGQDVKGQLKAPVEFVLPLFGQAAGADDEAALQIAADDQLLDEQPRHDGLAGARVVGQQETQRLARQHRLVDRRDLVRERIDEGRVHGEHRVEQMRQADAMRFGHEPEQMAVAVKAPGAALLDHGKARFVVAIQQLVGDPAGRVLVGEFQRLGAKPLDTDDGDEAIREDAAHGGVGLEVFERAHAVHPGVSRWQRGARGTRTGLPQAWGEGHQADRAPATGVSSDGSRLLRSVAAARNSWASKPSVAPLPFLDGVSAFFGRPRGIGPPCSAIAHAAAP